MAVGLGATKVDTKYRTIFNKQLKIKRHRPEESEKVFVFEQLVCADEQALFMASFAGREPIN